MKSWNELSMAEKADVMKLAIEGGVYDLDSIRSGYNEYAKGGKIHIDPSKKGTFTAAASKHGKSVQAFASQVLAHPENYSPAMRKKANFARNSRKWKHDDGGEIVYGRPYYSYDWNGNKVDDTLNVNATLPEIVITPDNRKSPGERAVLERQRRANQERATGKGTYDAMRDSEWTGLQVLAAQKAWEESAEKKALDYAQAAASGIGVGADIVSGLPIYSSLKGASVLSRAETPLDYAEGAMWVAPALGGAYQTTKPIVKQAIQTAIDNGGFAVSSPRIGKIFGKDAGQFTAWVPFDRPWSEGLSWINTGEPTAEGLPIQYITSKHSGEGRKLYDAVINKAREEGYPGIITGRELISAPKTYRTLEHYYPNRVKLDDMGHWSNDSMTGMFEGPRKTVYSLDDFLQSVQETPNERVHFLGAPRYRLETPSTQQSVQLPGNSAFSNEPETIGDILARMKRDSNISKYANSQRSPVEQMQERMSDPEYRAMIKDNSSSMFTSKEDPIYIEGYDPNDPSTYDGIIKQAENWWKTHHTAFDNKDVINDVIIPGLKEGQPFATGPAPYAYIPKKDRVFSIPMFKSAEKGEEAKELAYQIIKSHEGSHVYSSPRVESPLNSFLRNQKGRSADYLENKKGAELSARGSQLKSYFGKKSISEDELKYAADHYVDDTGVNNNMEDMFWHIKQAEKTDPDIWKKMAKWFTEVSPAVSTLLYLNKE